jgi:CubicO group peptidase (beta-lactamase class C family)
VNAVSRKIDGLFRAKTGPTLPGYAVGVVRDGEVVHAQGYGAADLEFGMPITPTTVFHVASLSKQFTACAILMLEAGRKLSLDDPVAKHVPEMPACASHITLRHLVHHTSGLRDQWPLLRLSGWRDMDEKTEDDVLDIVRRQDRLNFQPGERFTYCNTGYTLLAHVVARVSKEPFRSFTTERIFKPLGMTAATHFRDDHTELLGGRARGYMGPREGPFGFWVPNFDLVGATSLHTTVEDLLVWSKVLMKPPRAFAPVVEALRRPGSLNDGRTLGYGAGLGLGKHRGLEIVRHSGWDLGYVAHLAVYPSEDCAVAVLGNLAALTPALMARRVAEACLEGRFPDEAATPIRLSGAELAEKKGVYRHSRTGWALWIDAHDDALLLSFNRPPRSPSGPALGVRLDPLDHSRFLLSDEVTEVTFDGDTLTLRGEFGNDDLFERAAPSNPGARALIDYTGTYGSRELGTSLDVLVDPDHGFVVTQRRGPTRPLSPAYEDAFTDDNKATYIFSRSRAGEIDGLTLATERAHHLSFHRI